MSDIENAVADPCTGPGYEQNIRNRLAGLAPDEAERQLREMIDTWRLQAWCGRTDVPGRYSDVGKLLAGLRVLREVQAKRPVVPVKKRRASERTELSLGHLAWDGWSPELRELVRKLEINALRLSPGDDAGMGELCGVAVHEIENCRHLVGDHPTVVDLLVLRMTAGAKRLPPGDEMFLAPDERQGARWVLPNGRTATSRMLGLALVEELKGADEEHRRPAPAKDRARPATSVGDDLADRLAMVTTDDPSLKRALRLLPRDQREPFLKAYEQHTQKGGFGKFTLHIHAEKVDRVFERWTKLDLMERNSLLPKKKKRARRR